MWIVMVKQDKAVVRFGFNNMSDAMEFVTTCAECGDEGTEVMIKQEDE